MKEYPQPNKNGMYTSEGAEFLQFEKDSASVTIRILEIGEQLWSFGLHIEIHQSGYSFGIGHEKHATREEAVTSAIKNIQWFLKTHQEEPETPYIIKWANSLNQMILF